MEKACLIGMVLLPIVSSGVWAQHVERENPDIAVEGQAPPGKLPRSLYLEPVESITVPENSDNPFRGKISRVHLYADGSRESGRNSLYLVAEMRWYGDDGDQPHIVGIFSGYTVDDEKKLELSDLDGDGFPELILRHERGAGATCMRIFRFSRKTNSDDESCITLSPMLKQVGFCRTGIGTVRLEDDGTVVVKTYPEGGRVPTSVKKYRLEQGADGMKEVE